MIEIIPIRRSAACPFCGREVLISLDRWCHLRENECCEHFRGVTNAAGWPALLAVIFDDEKTNVQTEVEDECPS